MRKMILCTVAVAASVSMSIYAASSASRSITLNITYDSSGYSCEYSGGDNPAGDVTFHVGTKASVALHLTGDRDYTIDDINIASDPNDQLSVASSRSPTTAVIQDKNTVAQTATYKVTAKDPDGTSVPCDPKIINN